MKNRTTLWCILLVLGLMAVIVIMTKLLDDRKAAGETSQVFFGETSVSETASIAVMTETEAPESYTEQESTLPEETETEKETKAKVKKEEPTLWQPRLDKHGNPITDMEYYYYHPGEIPYELQEMYPETQSPLDQIGVRIVYDGLRIGCIVDNESSFCESARMAAAILGLEGIVTVRINEEVFIDGQSGRWYLNVFFNDEIRKIAVYDDTTFIFYDIIADHLVREGDEE